MKNFDPKQIEAVLEALIHQQDLPKNVDPKLVQLLGNLLKPMESLRADPDFKNILRRRIESAIDQQKLPWYKKIFFRKTTRLLPLSGKTSRPVYRSLVLGTLLIASGGLWWSEFFSPSYDTHTMNPSLLTIYKPLKTDLEPVIISKDALLDEVVLTPKKSFEKGDGYLERKSERSKAEFRREKSASYGGGPLIMPMFDSPGLEREVSVAGSAPEFMEFSSDVAMPQSGSSMPPQNFSALKGGEVDDNTDFVAYQKYTQTAPKDGAYNVDLARYQIGIKNLSGGGLFGETVEIVDNHGVQYVIKTDTDGSVYFFPGLHPRYATKKTTNDRINPVCLDRPNIDPVPMPYMREITDDYVMPRRPQCDAYFEGYRFDLGAKKCVFERSSGCDRPSGLFEALSECQQTCQPENQAVIDPMGLPTNFTVTVAGETKKFTEADKKWSFEIDPIMNNSVTLDLAFVLDTTGSMSDQIRQLKTTIADITKKIRSTDKVQDIRYGLVVYRDKTDAYVTRIYDFTTSLDEFQQTLNAIQANGGGDYPEDVNSALEDAMERLSWAEKSVKLSFLVADAPPHMDYDQAYDYLIAIKRATAKGIKIFPLASSGLDNSVGEYIFRQLALGTNAKYVFITNSRGGTDYHVGEQQYSVQQLDDLIVEVIKGELDGLE